MANRTNYLLFRFISCSSTSLLVVAAWNTIKPRILRLEPGSAKKNAVINQLVMPAMCIEGRKLKYGYHKLFPFSGNLKQKHGKMQDIFQGKLVQVNEFLKTSSNQTQRIQD